MRVICSEAKEVRSTDPKVYQYRLQTDGAVDPVSGFAIESKEKDLFEKGAQYDVAFTKVVVEPPAGQ